MAILSINGLDTLTQPSDFFLGRATNDDFTSFSGVVNYLPTGGVYGGGALEITSGAYINGGFTTGTQGILGFLKLPTGFSDTYIYNHWAGNTNAIKSAVRIMADGSIVVYREQGVLLQTLFPAGTIQAETFYYFCVRFTTSTSTTVTVKINNVEVESVVSTFSRLNTRVRYFEGGSVVVDDLCIVSGSETALPPQAIYTLSPNSNDTPQDFSFTGGASAWESIAEKVQDGDTSYISAGGVGNVSKFGLEELPIDVTDIKAVQGYAIASREASGGINNCRITIKTSGGATVGTVDAVVADGVYNTFTTGSTESSYLPSDIDGMTIEFEVI